MAQMGIMVVVGMDAHTNQMGWDQTMKHPMHIDNCNCLDCLHPNHHVDIDVQCSTPCNELDNTTMQCTNDNAQMLIDGYTINESTNDTMKMNIWNGLLESTNKHHNVCSLYDMDVECPFYTKIHAFMMESLIPSWAIDNHNVWSRPCCKQCGTIIEWDNQMEPQCHDCGCCGFCSFGHTMYDELGNGEPMCKYGHDTLIDNDVVSINDCVFGDVDVCNVPMCSNVLIDDGIFCNKCAKQHCPLCIAQNNDCLGNVFDVQPTFINDDDGIGIICMWCMEPTNINDVKYNATFNLIMCIECSHTTIAHSYQLMCIDDGMYGTSCIHINNCFDGD